MNIRSIYDAIGLTDEVEAVLSKFRPHFGDLDKSPRLIRAESAFFADRENRDLRDRRNRERRFLAFAKNEETPEEEDDPIAVELHLAKIESDELIEQRKEMLADSRKIFEKALMEKLLINAWGGEIFEREYSGMFNKPREFTDEAHSFRVFHSRLPSGEKICLKESERVNWDYLASGKQELSKRPNGLVYAKWKEG